MKHAHVWRLVNRDVASYSDIVRHWDINEVMTANEWLDIRDDQEYLIDQRQKAEAAAAKSKGK